MALGEGVNNFRGTKTQSIAIKSVMLLMGLEENGVTIDKLPLFVNALLDLHSPVSRSQ